MAETVAGAAQRRRSGSRSRLPAFPEGFFFLASIFFLILPVLPHL